MDLHVPVCVGGSVLPVPPVVTDPVRVLRSPQVVYFTLCLCILALPSVWSGIPAYICCGVQRIATCVTFHRHHGTGR